MDREIPLEIKNRRLGKTLAIISIILVVLVLFFVLLRQIIKPSVDRSKIDISVVKRGMLETTISASGTVVAEDEFIITSPINAKIEKVLHHPGETVGAGESLLQLNMESTIINYNKLLDEQEVNRNKIDQLQLNFEKNIAELQTQLSIKEMRIESLKSALDHERSLLKIGGGTQDRVNQALLSLNIAQLELKNLKSQIKNEESITKTNIKTLGYEMNIKSKSIAEIEEKLNQAKINSPKAGSIIWIFDQVGAEVNSGAEMARLANLNSFKIEGTVIDSYGTQIKLGGDVYVRIGNVKLKGKVTNVQPTVKNGAIKFFVALEAKNHPLLRPNLKADVFVVTSVKSSVVRVKNGPIFDGSVSQKVFVVKGNEAIARQVTLGGSNYDFIEIINGLSPGEQIITSNMQDYLDNDKLLIND